MIISNARSLLNMASIQKDMTQGYCSLEQLAKHIEFTYNHIPDIFDELTVDKVLDIQNRIRNGRYTLLSLQLLVVSSKENIKSLNFAHIMHLLINNEIYYGIVTPIQEDKLVLMALGRMLNHAILDLNLLNENSFGLKTILPDYYSHIISIDRPILRLYKLDMTNSLRVINKESLLTKLEPIVKNDEIMKLLKSYLYMPIILEGKDITYLMKDDSIPSSGLITDVLLNFSLINLDNKFQELFPEFLYTRYIHEVLIKIPTTASKQVQNFEEQIVEVFDDLNLAGKIMSIGPGDEPLPCHHGGIISISREGILQLKI